MPLSQRQLARVIVFKVLYNRLLLENNPLADIYLFQQSGLVGETKVFAEKLLASAWDNKDEIEKHINERLENTNKDRLQTNLYALFLLSVGELFYMPKQDRRIIINEALLIARSYIGEHVIALCNGVLHKLADVKEWEASKTDVTL